MTPEERAKGVIFFLREYLNVRDRAMLPTARQYDWDQMELAESFLGTALVALVTDARKVDE
jgi:hypothetical protein